MSPKSDKPRFKKVPLEVPFNDLNPLNVQCATTKCEEDLHCFRMTPKQIAKMGKEGLCISCNETRVDFEKVREVGLSDPEYLIKSLNFELIRKVYWTTTFPPDLVKKTLDLGRDQIRNNASKIISNKIGIINPWNNGVTPYTGDIIFYAQHATGTCCRRCMEYWYKFPVQDVALSDDQINFSTEIINLYLERRIPDLFT